MRARDVLDDALGLELGERRDLADARLAVLLLHVRDDRSRRSMQKSTSKSGMLTRSGFRKRSKSRLYGMGSRSVIRIEYATMRARAGAAARADGDAVLLRVADEVPDDEEVARELHLADDVELHLEALAVRVLVDLLAERRELAEARARGPRGDVAEVRRLVVALGTPKLGSIGLPSFSFSCALLGDRERVRDRLGDVGEELRHLVAASSGTSRCEPWWRSLRLRVRCGPFLMHDR